MDEKAWKPGLMRVKMMFWVLVGCESDDLAEFNSMCVYGSDPHLNQ